MGFNSYPLGSLIGPFEAMDTVRDPYFHFCYELDLKEWDTCSSIKSQRVHDLDHIQPLASFKWSGLSDQQTLLLTESVYSAWNGALKMQLHSRVASVFYSSKWERSAPASTDQGLLAKTAAIYMELHNYACLPPPIPPFLLAQNLFK